ncbi:hypothetical protein Q9S36_03040 [Microbacterium sp. ARD31]|uniref:hypothetical protein n=1 Tax=Microbacterium sp. ARD31 TaxID=2962576 RepID=UPI00288249F3|nr:hypothetical protein [Microbacterium sp. ARD31]MDT0179183.1 hypothetical protein [Microbacterium sp. ARD31]
MSYFDSGQPPARPTDIDAPVPQLVFLGIVGGLSLIAAIIFAVWSGNIDIWEYSRDSDIALKVGLGAWADILMIVGIVASVGAIVLDGVMHLLKRVVGAAVVPPASPVDPA